MMSLTERTVQAFCACTLPKAEWTHWAHLRVGLWHLLRYDPEETLGLLRTRIRALNESHCTTIVDFKNGDIQAQNLQLKNFIDSVLDGQGKVLDASEQSDQADRAKPFNPLYWLVDQLLG